MAEKLQGTGGYFYLTQRWTIQSKAKLLLNAKMVFYQLAFVA